MLLASLALVVVPLQAEHGCTHLIRTPDGACHLGVVKEGRRIEFRRT